MEQEGEGEDNRGSEVDECSSDEEWTEDDALGKHCCYDDHKIWDGRLRFAWDFVVKVARSVSPNDVVELELCWIHSVSPELRDFVNRDWVNLNVMRLYRCNITNADLQSFNPKKLKTLLVESCPKLLPGHINDFLKSRPNIIDAFFVNHNMSDEDVAKFEEMFPNIKFGN